MGYLSSENSRVVVDGSVGASSFEVVDLGGKVVFSGDLKSGGGAFGNYSFGDFTVPGVLGTYRSKAGSEYSMWFPIGLEAKLNYKDYLRKHRNAYRRKRCGNTTTNWGGKACHLEDARMDGDKRHAIVGGWLKAATRCYNYFEKTWPVVTDYETTFSARPYLEKVTDLMPLAYGIRANLYMYLATDNPAYKNRAVDLADQLMALQEKEYIEGQKEVRGFFYANANKDSIFSSYMAHGGLDGAPGAVIVLADLCEALPTHSECPRWKESLRSYLEGYLLPLSNKNAFGIVPGYLSRQPLVDGKHVGGLYHQYLDDTGSGGAAALLSGMFIVFRIRRKPLLMCFNESALEWVIVNAVFATSTTRM